MSHRSQRSLMREPPLKRCVHARMLLRLPVPLMPARLASQPMAHALWHPSAAHGAQTRRG
jgi:hypothetical protein